MWWFRVSGLGFRVYGAVFSIFLRGSVPCVTPRNRKGPPPFFPRLQVVYWLEGARACSLLTKGFRASRVRLKTALQPAASVQGKPLFGGVRILILWAPGP